MIVINTKDNLLCRWTTEGKPKKTKRGTTHQITKKVKDHEGVQYCSQHSFFSVKSFSFIKSIAVRII